MWEPKFREVKLSEQGHTAIEWENWISSPDWTLKLMLYLLQNAISCDFRLRAQWIEVEGGWGCSKVDSHEAKGQLTLGVWLREPMKLFSIGCFLKKSLQHLTQEEMRAKNWTKWSLYPVRRLMGGGPEGAICACRPGHFPQGWLGILRPAPA